MQFVLNFKSLKLLAACSVASHSMISMAGSDHSIHIDARTTKECALFNMQTCINFITRMSHVANKINSIELLRRIRLCQRPLFPDCPPTRAASGGERRHPLSRGECPDHK